MSDNFVATATIPINLTIPVKITPRLSLKAQLKGSTTFSSASIDKPTGSFDSATVEFGLAF